MGSIPNPRLAQDYTFGPYRLEVRNGTLLLHGNPVSIAPRALAVLHALVEQAGDVVTKENLVEKVWSGAFIEDSNITKNVAEVRRVLRAGFRDADPIRTVWKMGYTFEAPVEVAAVEPPAEAVLPAALPDALTGALPVALPEHFASRQSAGPRVRPARKYPKILMALSVLVPALFLVWLAWSAHLGGRRTVAVLGIRNLSGSESADWIGPAVAEMLSSELQSGGSLRAVPAEDVARMRADLGLLPQTQYDRAVLRRVHTNLNCDVAVIGTVLTTGSGLRLDLRVENAADGETRGALSETGSAENLLELVTRTGVDLRRMLGDAVRPQPPAALASVGAEALKQYAEGLEHLRAWDAAGAQGPLAQAAAAAPQYAPIHTALSLDWSLLGFDGRAREEAKRALDSASGLPREQQLQVEARFAETAADWPKAIETWRALRTFYPDEADYTERLAAALTTSGKAKEALALLQSVTPHSEKSRDARLLLAESNASFALADYPSAVRAATEADAAARQSSARLLDSRALEARGRAYYGLSDYARADADYVASGAISGAIGDRGGSTRMLLARAQVMRVTSTGNAEPIVRQALEAGRAIGDRNGVMQALLALHTILRAKADMKGAGETQQECLAIARETGNANMEIQALNNLGNIANNTGDQAGARGYYAASMARANEVGDPRSTAIALGNIATLDFAEGDLRSALTQMQEALKLKRGVGDRSSIAYTLIYLGRVSTYAGNFSDARRYFEEADALQQAIHEKSVEPAIFLAQLSIAEGKPEAAEAAMLPMAPRFQKPNPAGNIWRVLTESRLLKGEVGKAREAADQAVSWGRKTPNRADFGIPCDLISARVEIAEKNFAGARKHLMDLLAESRKLKHMVNEFTIRLALVELEAQSGNLRAATEASHSLARDSAQHGFGLIATAAVRAAKTPVLAAR